MRGRSPTPPPRKAPSLVVQLLLLWAVISICGGCVPIRKMQTTTDALLGGGMPHGMGWEGGQVHPHMFVGGPLLCHLFAGKVVGGSMGGGKGPPPATGGGRESVLGIRGRGRKRKMDSGL